MLRRTSHFTPRPYGPLVPVLALLLMRSSCVSCQDRTHINVTLRSLVENHSATRLLPKMSSLIQTDQVARLAQLGPRYYLVSNSFYVLCLD